MAKRKKKKVDMMASIKVGWGRFSNLTPETLSSIRNMFMFLLLADLIGVLGILKYKTLGMFIFLLVMAGLTFTLVAERGNDKQMYEQIESEMSKAEPKDKFDKKVKKKEKSFRETLGIDNVMDEMAESFHSSFKQSVI